MPGVIVLAPHYLANDPSFTIYSSTITLAANQYMLSIQNTLATHVVEIYSLRIFNRQTTAVVGVFAEFQLKRGTALVGGTNLTTNIVPRNRSQTLVAGINAFRTITSLTGEEANPIEKWTWTTDEMGAGDTSKIASGNLAFQTVFNLLETKSPYGPITLVQNNVLAVKQVTAAPTGSAEIQIGFVVRQVT